MTKIASAILGLSFAVAGLSFGQTPAATAPAKDGAMATAPAKKHAKHVKKNAAKAEKPAAAATPAAK